MDSSISSPSDNTPAYQARIIRRVIGKNCSGIRHLSDRARISDIAQNGYKEISSVKTDPGILFLDPEISRNVFTFPLTTLEETSDGDAVSRKELLITDAGVLLLSNHKFCWKRDAALTAITTRWTFSIIRDEELVRLLTGQHAQDVLRALALAFESSSARHRHHADTMHSGARDFEDAILYL